MALLSIPSFVFCKWVKVMYLHVGDEIAVQNGETIAWEKIKSIEQLPAERVYDIEVEGTHNFVAGHFIDKQQKTVSDLPFGSVGEEFPEQNECNNKQCNGNLSLCKIGIDINHSYSKRRLNSVDAYKKNITPSIFPVNTPTHRALQMKQ